MIQKICISIGVAHEHECQLLLNEKKNRNQNSMLMYASKLFLSKVNLFY